MTFMQLTERPEERRPYIGTKCVEAWPAQRRRDPTPAERDDLGIADRDAYPDASHHILVEGYAVVYDDGYLSWSPKAAFDAAYQPSTAMGCEGALWALKHGYAVTYPGLDGYISLSRGSGGVPCWVSNDGRKGVWHPLPNEITREDWSIR